MKRAIAFVTALVIAAGAVAPAASVFADDFPATQSGNTIISIDDLDDDSFDAIFQPYDDSELYDRDSWINKTIEAIGSNMVALGNEYPLLEQFFMDAPGLNVLYGTEKLKWLYKNVGIDVTTGEIVSLGNDMTTDSLDEYLDTTLKNPGSFTPPSPSSGSGWVYLAPYVYSGWYIWATEPYSNTFYDSWVAGVGTVGSGTQGFAICTLQNGNFVMRYKQGSASLPSNSLGTFSAIESITGNNYKYGNQSLQLGLTASYSSVSDAVSDFYGNGSFTGGAWNGTGYYDDSRQFSINIPALQGVDWSNLSHRYYYDYGESFTDASSVSNFYYDISNNYAPYEVTYDLPYWLINGNTSIETFDYSLVLPSAPLETLPEDFEGGGSFFQNAFMALGSFGAFVLLGLSFSLVGLFFKE